MNCTVLPSHVGGKLTTSIGPSYVIEVNGVHRRHFGIFQNF